MKNIFIIAFLSFGLCCKAQTPVKSIYEDNPDIAGAYYKDLYNDFNNFVGTWKYTNGPTSLTITLQKKEMQYFNDGHIEYYEDLLIGEYQYIENGVEKINTLAGLQIEYDDNRNHNMVGNIVIGPNSQYCQNCGTNDRKVVLGFVDPGRSILGFQPEMIFQRLDLGSQQRVKLVFRTRSGAIYKVGEPLLYTSYTVPFGEYIMVKQ